MQTQEITTLYKWAWIVLIILAVFLGVKTLGGLKDLRDIDPVYNSITVTGEGEVFSVPDVATFSFTVSVDADSVALAQEQVTKKMDAVLAKLKELGIEDKDVKTVDYSVWPKYIYTSVPCTPAYCPPSRQEQKGFTASHTVSVKVRNTDNAGKALAAAGESGATGLSSISFTIDDPEKVTDEARALAIADAKEKAQTLSKELDVRIVRVVSFNDVTEGGVVPYYRELGMGGDTATVPAKAPTLPTGENKVRVVVNVTYEIR